MWTGARPGRYAGKVIRRACAEDRAIYEQIGSLGRTLTGSREDAKVAHLTELASRQDVVLAFDSHLISLDFLRREPVAKFHCRLAGDHVQQLGHQPCPGASDSEYWRIWRRCNDSRFSATLTYCPGLNAGNAPPSVACR